MSRNLVYERDLLYPTDSLFDPGSIHIEVLSPDKNGKIPVVIESKTAHSPVNYINSIISIMQTDIFDRIHVNLKTNAGLYIKLNDGLKQKFGEYVFIRVKFENDKIEYVGKNEFDD